MDVVTVYLIPNAGLASKEGQKIVNAMAMNATGQRVGWLNDSER